MQFHIRIDIAQVVIHLTADVEVNMTCRPGQADAVIPINIAADWGRLIFIHSKGRSRAGHTEERDNESNSIMFEHFLDWFYWSTQRVYFFAVLDDTAWLL